MLIKAVLGDNVDVDSGLDDRDEVATIGMIPLLVRFAKSIINKTSRVNAVK